MVFEEREFNSQQIINRTVTKGDRNSFEPLGHYIIHAVHQYIANYLLRIRSRG